MLKRGIKKFMQYDYVGAPWPWFDESGNGGFSLRSVAVMMEGCLLAFNDDNKNANEDSIFSRFVAKNYKSIPASEAYKFSRELRIPKLDCMTAEGGKLDGHLALHRAWSYDSENILRIILNHSLEQLKNENKSINTPCMYFDFMIVHIL